MKVLFISSFRKGKGISPFIFCQGEFLKRNGIKIHFFLLEGSGLINYIRSISKIKKCTKSHSFDLIHAHFGLSGIVTRIAAPHKKLIVSFLGDDLEGSIGPKGKYTFLSRVLVLVNRFFAKYFFDYNIPHPKTYIFFHIERQIILLKQISITLL